MFYKFYSHPGTKQAAVLSELAGNEEVKSLHCQIFGHLSEDLGATTCNKMSCWMFCAAQFCCETFGSFADCL